MKQVQEAPTSASIHSITRLLVAVGFGSFCIFAIRPLLSIFEGDSHSPQKFEVECIVLLCALAIATLAFHYILRRIRPSIDAICAEQARVLDRFDARYAPAAVFLAAALSLFLELAIIRWQSSALPFIALYKNFSLLACFLGLGLGYALASRDRIALVIVLPLLTWQFGLLTFIRYGLGNGVTITPFREQLTMGFGQSSAAPIFFLYWILATIFLLTSLTFVPIGQLCGRLMEHTTKLRAYGLNLLGSLAGVLLMLLASSFWTPPLVWFALCFLAVLLFTSRSRAPLSIGLAFVAASICILAWPVAPQWNRVYSPYQLLEVGTSNDTGLTRVLAAGHYYQRIFDFSDKQSTRWKAVRDYYEFPFRAHPALKSVAIVGAGTGNDIAAGLRLNSEHIEAIEIDPAIQSIGISSHPEHPYTDARVHTEINDARSFFRTTNQKFDLIVYGLLDSHTLLSQGSSVRVDSFVYTLEGLREARSRLNQGGVLSLSFSVLTDALGRKIYLMLQQAFDGRAPICVSAGYDGSVIFIESNDPAWTIPPKLFQDAGFSVITPLYANPSLKADISTDDWPFFYMPQRVYPLSYLVMILLILVLSALLVSSFTSERPKFNHASFFFLGAGFMLIETKGITELGLTFGNTWLVIGIVISGILIMSFLGNCAVAWLKIKSPFIPYFLLFGGILLGWYLAGHGGLPSTALGRLGTAITLTLPVLFSGIVFSTLLSKRGQVSGMMAMNLVGGIFGGLLEYNSMYFGFRFLYLIALGCYVAAFILDAILKAHRVAEVQDIPTVASEELVKDTPLVSS